MRHSQLQPAAIPVSASLVPVAAYAQGPSIDGPTQAALAALPTNAASMVASSSNKRVTGDRVTASYADQLEDLSAQRSNPRRDPAVSRPVIARWLVRRGVAATLATPALVVADGGRLCVADRQNARIVVLDTASGRMTASVALDGVPESLAHDRHVSRAALRRVARSASWSNCRECRCSLRCSG